MKLFENNYGRFPKNNQELIGYIVSISKHSQKSLIEVLELRQDNFSLNRCLNSDNEDGDSYLDFLENRKIGNPEEGLFHEIQKTKINEKFNQYLSFLHPKEEIVFRLKNLYLNENLQARFGERLSEMEEILLRNKPQKIINKGLSLELDQIGELIGLSKERVRQLLEKASVNLQAYFLKDDEIRNFFPGYVKNVASKFSSDFLEKSSIDEIKRELLRFHLMSKNSISEDSRDKMTKRFADFDKQTFLNFIDKLSSEKDRRLMKWIYGFEQNDPQEPLNGVRTLDLVAFEFKIEKSSIFYRKNNCEEMFDYLIHAGIEPQKKISETRNIVMKEYKKVAEQALENIEDDFTRNLLRLRFKLNPDIIERQYSLSCEELTRKKIANLLGFDRYFSLKNKEDNAVRKLWENMKLIMDAEDYSKS